MKIQPIFCLVPKPEKITHPCARVLRQPVSRIQVGEEQGRGGVMGSRLFLVKSRMEPFVPKSACYQSCFESFLDCINTRTLYHST